MLGTVKVDPYVVTVGGAKAAEASVESEFVAVGLKPLTVRPNFSRNGVSMSYRTPRLTVRRSLTRQSS
jgi:hypothetical protein